MDDGRFEQELEGLLRIDFSVGTEAFRDGLLARCLAVLDADVCDGAEELDDADLELLAAAGDATRAVGQAPLGCAGKAPGHDFYSEA